MYGSDGSVRCRIGAIVSAVGLLIGMVSFAAFTLSGVSAVSADDPELIAPSEFDEPVVVRLDGTTDRDQPFAVDPNRIEGNDKCVDCHKLEFASWKTSHHAMESFDMLRTGDYAKQSLEFCEKLGIPENLIAKSSICIECHATKIATDGRNDVLPGVSCESCHGGSGGEDGWLNIHAVYGPSGTPRDAETPEHRDMRAERCLQAGQVRVDNPFRMAQACFKCHVVWDQSLVDIAEHPSSSERFNFVTWSLGEVRHNFHLDPRNNALISSLWANPTDTRRDATLQNRIRLMYLSGILGQLQAALANRARATEDGDFASDMEGLAEDNRDSLEEYVEDFSEDDESDEYDYDPDDLPSLQAAVAASDEAFLSLEDILDAVDDDDQIPDEEKGAEIYRRSAAAFRRAAELVAIAGDQFCARHDGSLLEVVDDDLPVISEDDESEAHYSDEWKRRHGIDE